VYKVISNYRKVQTIDENKIDANILMKKFNVKKQLLKDKGIDLTEDEKIILDKDKENIQRIRDEKTDMPKIFAAEQALEAAERAERHIRKVSSELIGKTDLLGFGGYASKYIKVPENNESPDKQLLDKLERKLDYEIQYLEHL
jgi:hypothetical protein